MKLFTSILLVVFLTKNDINSLISFGVTVTLLLVIRDCSLISFGVTVIADSYRHFSKASRC